MIEAPDLSDLAPKDAKRIVLDYIVTLKKTRAQLREAKEEFTRWEERHRLATERGESELAERALDRARHAVEDHERLGGEERELEVVVETLRKQLRLLEAAPRRTVDAQGLLSQIERVVGTDYEAKDAAQELDAEAELERLKKQLSEED